MLNLTTVNTIFFDLDGTLTSYEASVKNALDLIYESTRPELRDIGHAEFCKAYWHVFDELESRQSAGKKQSAFIDRTQRFDRVLSELGQPESRDLAKKMSYLYARGRVQGVHVFEHAHEVIRSLRKTYSLGVITEGASIYQRELLKNTQLLGFFDYIIISEETGFHKPDPQLFQIACDSAVVQPVETVMIGDRIDWDIVPSKSIGMQTILFTQDSRYYHKQSSDHSCIDAIAPDYRTIQSLLLSET
jgi:putative hydrolase of the HAD superfamily